MAEQEHLTYEEALEELGVERSELNELIREGRLEEQVVEGQTRFLRAQVMAVKEALLAGGAAESGDTALMEGEEIEVEAEPETPAEEESREEFFDFSEALEEDFELEEPEPVGEEEELPVIELEEGPEDEEEIVTAVLEPTDEDIDEAELLSEILEIEEGEEEAPVAGPEVAEVGEEEVTADITAAEEPEVAEPVGFPEELEEVEIEEAGMEEEQPEFPTAQPVARTEQASTWPTVLLVVALVVLALAAVFMVENTVRPEFSTPLTGWLPL